MEKQAAQAVRLPLLQFFFFFTFKTSPHLLQLLKGMLQHRFAAKPHKCFVDYKTSPDFPSARGQVDHDRIFIFGWPYPLTRRHSVVLRVRELLVVRTCKLKSRRTKNRCRSQSDSGGNKRLAIVPVPLWALTVEGQVEGEVVPIN